MPDVIVAIEGMGLEIGRLHFERDGHRQFSTFTYSSQWLENSSSFAIAPGFPLGLTAVHSSGRENARDALGAPFADAAPDSWGRGLLARAHGRGLSELELLLGCADETRLGALQFLDGQRRPLGQSHVATPRVADLQSLSTAVARYEANPERDEAHALAAASGALGGARPKTNVADGRDLWIAKFTSVRDSWPVERAEVAILSLADQVGLRVPESRLALSGTVLPVALFRRFDRRNGERIAYMSARTALEVSGTQRRCYTDIADVLETLSPDPQSDMRELWCRMVFSMLVNNTDDHLKNHGFLHAGHGAWRLSPAFDINCQPRRAPQMETGISPIHGFDPDILAAIDAAPLFELPETFARGRVKQMAEVLTRNWRAAFLACGIRGGSAAAYGEILEGAQVERARSL